MKPSVMNTALDGPLDQSGRGVPCSAPTREVSHLDVPWEASPLTRCQCNSLIERQNTSGKFTVQREARKCHTFMPDRGSISSSRGSTGGRSWAVGFERERNMSIQALCLTMNENARWYWKINASVVSNQGLGRTWTDHRSFTFRGSSLPPYPLGSK